MMNSLLNAKGWVQLLAKRPEVPFGSKLEVHFAAGHVTRLCDCGCNSFDLDIPATTTLDPLCEASEHGGVFFEAVFESNADSDVDCMFFADKRGYLAGIDVMYGEANHAPLPDDIRLGQLRYVVDHVRISKSAGAADHQ